MNAQKPDLDRALAHYRAMLAELAAQASPIPYTMRPDATPRPMLTAEEENRHHARNWTFPPLD
jgi:hypothetical protein